MHTHAFQRSNRCTSVLHLDGIRVNFVFAPLSNGNGTQVLIDVQTGLSKIFSVSPTGGFDYHIHVNPVGPNNNCTATGGHLDPTVVGELKKCDRTKPNTCQVGDLSGKSAKQRTMTSLHATTFVKSLC